MTKFWSIFLILVFGDCMIAHAQQQFTYSQFLDNLTPISPVWSLTKESGELNLLSRKQWINIDGAPVTTMVNGYVPIENISAKIGFALLSDKVTVEHFSELNLFFAKEVRISENGHLGVAVNGGLGYFSADYSSLDDSDPALINTDVREYRPNVGVSAMYYQPGKMYLSVSVPRLSFNAKGKPPLLLQQRNYYYITLGYTFNVSDELELDNGSVISWTGNLPTQIDLASKLWFRNTLGFGLGYRKSNELSFLSSYKIGKIRAGYSYEIGMGNTRIGDLNGGTHEISIGFWLGRNQPVKDFIF